MIVSAPDYISVFCDDCSAAAVNHRSADPDVTSGAQVLDDAVEHGWTVNAMGRHTCPTCTRLGHPRTRTDHSPGRTG